MRVSCVDVIWRVRMSSANSVSGRKASSSRLAGLAGAFTAPRTGCRCSPPNCMPAGTGLKTSAGATAFGSATACSASSCPAWRRRPSTICLRCSSSKWTPASSSAQATVAAEMSAPSASLAHNTPGRRVEPSPRLPQNVMKARRSVSEGMMHRMVRESGTSDRLVS